MVGLAVGLGTAARAQAGGEHSHSAPHGGEVVEVAEHHVEFKADPSGAISVWLLDAKEKTVPPPAGGKVTLMPEGSDPVTLPLQVDSGSQRLGAAFDATKLKSFQAVVSLAIEGKRHNFRFHYPPSQH
ncbi:MAG: hypothetical protein ABIY46_09055 [Gemmatimonadales bacterium]